MPRIDGLRGILALAVVFHHASIYHEFLFSGTWKSPPAGFYAMLGPVSVSLFFMVTGYLFWQRLVRAKGRPEWGRLYTSRLFRIGPLYLTTITIMLISVAFLTGFTLQSGRQRLALDIGRWLFTLGLLEGGVVNNYAKTTVLLAMTTWTIRFEWLFYLSLLPLSLATRNSRWHLPFTAICLAACLVWIDSYQSGRAVALFLAGMFCASMNERGLLVRIPDKVGSLLVLAALAGVFQSSDARKPTTIILLGLVFYLIISGSSVFGLLTSKPARRLGEISYGIYLFQGLVLAAVYWPAPMRTLALKSPVYHWELAVLAALILVSVSTIAHVTIELPGIALGHRIAEDVVHLVGRISRTVSRQATAALELTYSVDWHLVKAAFSRRGVRERSSW